MDFPSTPESNTYTMDFETNTPYEQQTEWNTLDKFLDWQQTSQPEFSSPESPLSDIDHDQYAKYNYATFDHHSNFHPLSSPWAQITPNTMSPTNNRSPPPNSLSEDFALYSEVYNENELPRAIGAPTPPSIPTPGLQLPKIGRPRAPPTTSENNGEGGAKDPTQARRRSQNREAQRAFRLRQRQYIEQIAVENKELIVKNAELEVRCEMLANAYYKVLSGNTRMGGIGKAGEEGGKKLVVG